MKRATISLGIMLAAQLSFGQLLYMDFETDSITPVIGPTPISISGSADTLSPGATGKGLSARANNGLPKRDVDMDFDGSTGYWDVSGIDVSIAFNREENTGSLFRRLGSGFNMFMAGGNLRMSYEVDDGAGSYVTINSGNIYSIPNDDVWRTYRFTYDPSTGTGEVTVDGVAVWTNDGPDNRGLYWVGAGNLRIGDAMDGTGRVEAIFDELLIDVISPLPIELISFDAHAVDGDVHLIWVSASEQNNDFYTVQRSQDGENWEDVLYVQGAGNSVQTLEYFDIDREPYEGLSYYRLRQTDFDGTTETFSPVPVRILSDVPGGMNIYPNPLRPDESLTIDFEGVEGSEVLVVVRDITGKEVYTKALVIEFSPMTVRLETMEQLAAGTYLITASSENSLYSRKFIVER